VHEQLIDKQIGYAPPGVDVSSMFDDQCRICFETTTTLLDVVVDNDDDDDAVQRDLIERCNHCRRPFHRQCLDAWHSVRKDEQGQLPTKQCAACFKLFGAQ
jgi:hypothetical protein